MSLHKKFLLIIVLGVSGFAAWFGAGWLAVFDEGLSPGQIKSVELSDVPSPKSPTMESLKKLHIDTIATGLDTPWSMVFTSPERMLVTERPGRIRVIEAGQLLVKPLHVFSEVSETGEEGLMSIVLHPEYRLNRWVYVSLAYESDQTLWVKVMRFTDEDTALGDPVMIIDRIPAARFHAGSALMFGPDGKLYLATGDATEKNVAQDIGSLAGKILRLNADGSIPEDNPFGNAVWSYGHRNPQGLAWHPQTNYLYASEHGPSVFDGPAGGDEINLIERGKNYGWPIVSHDKRHEGTETPLITFTPAEAPASLMVYSGRHNTLWQGNLFFGALRGEGLVRVVLDPSDAKKIMSVEKLAEVGYGRIRAVVEGPDGFVYFSTSNRDGRGKPETEDDRVFRLSFKE